MTVSVFRMQHWNNKLMILACVLGVILQLAVTEVDVLTRAFGTVSLSLREWLYLAGLAAFPLLAHECLVFCGMVSQIRWRRKKTADA